MREWAIWSTDRPLPHNLYPQLTRFHQLTVLVGLILFHILWKCFWDGIFFPTWNPFVAGCKSETFAPSTGYITKSDPFLIYGKIHTLVQSDICRRRKTVTYELWPSELEQHVTRTTSWTQDKKNHTHRWGDMIAIEILSLSLELDEHGAVKCHGYFVCMWPAYQMFLGGPRGTS